MPLDERGLPTDKPPVEGRRSSALLSPIPKFRKQRGKNKADAQQDLGLHADDGVSDDKQQYATTTLINEIRAQVSQWRRLPNPNDWQVTPTTRKLLEYWRSHEFQTIRPVLLPGGSGRNADPRRNSRKLPSGCKACWTVACRERRSAYLSGPDGVLGRARDVANAIGGAILELSERVEDRNGRISIGHHASGKGARV